MAARSGVSPSTFATSVRVPSAPKSHPRPAARQGRVGEAWAWGPQPAHEGISWPRQRGTRTRVSEPRAVQGGGQGGGGRAAWTAEEEKLVPGTRGFCFSVGCGLGFAFLFSEEAEGGRGRRVRTELRARHSRGPQAQAGMSLPGGSAPERGESRERVVLGLLARSRRNLQRQGFRRPAEPPPPGAQRCRLTTGTFPACGELGEQVGRCRSPTAARGGPAGDTSFVFKKLRRGLLDGVTGRSPGRRSEGRSD